MHQYSSHVMSVKWPDALPCLGTVCSTVYCLFGKASAWRPIPTSFIHLEALLTLFNTDPLTLSPARWQTRLAWCWTRCWCQLSTLNRSSRHYATLAHAFMSNHGGPSNMSTAPSKPLSPRPNPNLIPVVEIPIRTRKLSGPAVPKASPFPLPSSSLIRPLPHVASALSAGHTSTLAAKPITNTRLHADQEEWTLDQVLREAHHRLRPIECKWTAPSDCCDAVLGSLNLFRKHLEVHYTRINRDPGPSIGLRASTKCPWLGCRVDGLGFIRDLRNHIKHAHFDKLKDTYCPIRTCPSPELHHKSNHHFTGPGHARPWNRSSLRPTPRPLPITAKPPPLTFSDEIIYPFLSTVRPYHPTPSLAHGLRTRAPQSRNRLAGLEYPLVPDRSDPNVYFWPMHGDAPSGLEPREFTSSSIFPYPAYHDLGVDADESDTELRAEARLRSDLTAQYRGRSTSPTMMDLDPNGFEGRAEAIAPLVIRSRPQWRSLEPLIDAEMSSWLASKRKAVEPPDGPWPEPLVVRTSKRLAREHSGCVVGIGHWKERLYFEKRGVQLGELPNDHHM
ncbi:hypothetical protein BD324DRAFT_156231 [Kockovaella imperatae]|uniref:Uncharacterized protein n=1 Tax=Kockovaella imperatae TaxID=4999 RepID=A0A1Y1U917_9TREE|nr:hypothetical protein BD324DRAFT_156231 [Kockovaella imperatae]ORX34518.1 hypothetical protein BD324DRAFT_156231 [Kockovaella imperatae]